MIEARVPNYTDVPCTECSVGPGQSCWANGAKNWYESIGSHRRRRKLWVAMKMAQDRGDNSGMWWSGRFIQVETRLR